MTQKTMNILLAMLGILAVAALFAVGANLQQAAVTGSWWKRRLVTAGLAVLGFFAGPAMAAAAELRPPTADVGEKASADLEASRHWKTVEETWAATVPLAESGQSTEAQRKKADQQLVAAKAALERLGKAGLLAPQEATLLAADADTIRERIHANPPVDFRGTCYDMAYLPPAQLSFKRLSARLPLVESLVKDGKVHPAASAKVIAAMEADLKLLSDPKLMSQLSALEREDAEAMRVKVSAALEGLKAQVTPPAPTVGGASADGELSARAEWKRLTAVWKDAEEVASGKRGAYPFDQKGQKTMLDSLSASAEDMDRLQQKGLLGEAEAGLLRLDLARLTQGVQSKRPTEMQMATCYEPMAWSPGTMSMARLSDRLPLLEKLAASERIHRDVVNKVLAQIETDLASLEKTEVTDRLSPVDRKKAEEVRKSVAVLVDKLKAAGARSE